MALIHRGEGREKLPHVSAKGLLHAACLAAPARNRELQHTGEG